MALKFAKDKKSNNNNNNNATNISSSTKTAKAKTIKTADKPVTSDVTNTTSTKPTKLQRPKLSAAVIKSIDRNVKMPLNKLILDPDNIRTHPEENLRDIKASLDRFGQIEPLVVQKKSGRVIAGNGRLINMRKRGDTHAYVTVVDCDDKTATELSVTLNRTGEKADWDDIKLTKFLASFAKEHKRAPVGFNDEDVKDLIENVKVETNILRGGNVAVESALFDDRTINQYAGITQPENAVDNIVADDDDDNSSDTEMSDTEIDISESASDEPRQKIRCPHCGKKF